MKFWRSKWDLRRHTCTVHANFKEKQDVRSVQPLPDTDEIMSEQLQQQENFPVWKKKKSATQAKLPSLKPKFKRPVDEDDEGEFESWNKKR